MLIQNGISTTISTTISKFNLKEGAIKDLAFLDEEFIVILLFTNCMSSLPHTSTPA
jgi:hypothetical protein